MKFKKYTLSNGYQIPVIGFGTYKLQGTEAKEMTAQAIDHHYRLIDTASMYANEKEIGLAIRKAIGEGKVRQDLFVVTKVWKDDMGYEKAKVAFEKSFEELGLSYVDLVLIHWPDASNEVNLETWRALEELYQRDKRIRAIGVSNFNEEQLQYLFDHGTIKPMVNQFESFPGNSQQALLDFCQKEDMVAMAYRPIDRGSILEEPILKKLAEKYNKTPAQIALRWSLERQMIPIPKTSRPERLIENYNLFDFELTDAEVTQLLQLDK